MAEHFSFFDAVLQDDGTYDREYNAQQFTKYFGALVTTGIMKGSGNMLAVSANGSNMVTKINTGIAFVEAKYYENDNFKELTHDTETLGNSRIDRIVIRMDLSTEARYVKAFIKKGVPSTNPVPPALTQTANLYEISLAQVKIVGGQTFIATNAVTDERGKDVICPWAGSNILPNFNADGLQELVDSQLVGPQGAIEYTGNLNDLLKSGFYKSKGATVSKNYPREVNDLHHVLIEVYETDEQWTLQIFTYWDNSYPVTYRRGRYLGVWSNWMTLPAGVSDSINSASPMYAASSNAVKQVNDKVDIASISLTPTSPFVTEYSGAFRVFKTGRIVALQIELKNTSQLTASQAYQVASLPVGYRPAATSLVGYVYAIVSGAFRYLPVTISSNGTIILQGQTTALPASSIIYGHITYATENI